LGREGESNGLDHAGWRDREFEKIAGSGKGERARSDQVTGLDWENGHDWTGSDRVGG